MRKIGFILLFFIITNIITSCEKFIFSQDDEVIVKTEVFDYFSNIEINDVFNVILISDSIFALEIETESDFIEKIFYTLDSATLKLGDINQFKWLPDYTRPTLKISFPKLDGTLFLRSPVNLYTPDTLFLPSLSIQSLGKSGEFSLNINVLRFQITTGSDNAAIYTIRGKSAYSRLWPRGSSIINASDLTSESANVFNNSIGDCILTVEDKLEARLNTLGNIYYYGTPEITILEESGSGRLLKGE